MYDKYDMWVSDYITFVLQLPPTGGIYPPAITVTFNSWEVWQVDENDGVDIELWTSEIGTSNSVVKRNGLSFLFNIEANYSPETRKKIFQLFHYVARGCDISFTFNGYNSYIPNFPHTNPNFIPTDLHPQSVNLPYACVQLPSKAIDSTGDGLGVLVGENSIINIIVKEAIDPYELAPCKRLSMKDFLTYPFGISDDGSGGYYISDIILELNPTGLIAQFLNHPDGALNTVPPATPNPITFVSTNIQNTIMHYEDPFTTALTNGLTYEITIPNIKVKLKTGETCEITFIQQFTFEY